jgi:hypothetical protein
MRHPSQPLNLDRNTLKIIDGHLPQGTVVVVLEGNTVVNGRTWQQVQSGNLSGWILADYLQ